MDGKWARGPRPAVVLAGLSALYVVCSWLVMTAAGPLPNEGWFFSPAVNLLRHGHMGTTNLVTQGTWMEGMERRTYWVPPMHFLAQAAWYALVGAGLMAMRALSVAWGVVALGAVYGIGTRLRLGRWAALLAVGLLALDFRWVITGAMGRMDMMCAALGLGGMAVYLALRERNLAWATVAAHALVCASCLTHAAGVVHGLALVVVTVALDWRRLSMRL
ncbi:MAG: glycosyltransferase family 39 protein, partial [Acidobacteria bacterium]|nr:glycosyltransferase family 39 protein [Acidobacteriota bacterium]